MWSAPEQMADSAVSIQQQQQQQAGWRQNFATDCRSCFSRSYLLSTSFFFLGDKNQTDWMKRKEKKNNKTSNIKMIKSCHKNLEYSDISYLLFTTSQWPNMLLPISLCKKLKDNVQNLY